MDGGRPRRGRVHDALGQAFAASTCARLLTRALSHAHTRTAELDALKCTAGRARTREDARGREGAWMKMQLTSALRASRTPWHGGEDAPARSTRRASIQDAGIRQEQDTWSSRRAHSDVGYGDVGCVAQ
jgi:hypothetical protein